MPTIPAQTVFHLSLRELGPTPSRRVVKAMNPSSLSSRELGPTPSRRVVKAMNPLLFVIARSEATWRSI
jgi:hypothetical protein